MQGWKRRAIAAALAFVQITPAWAFKLSTSGTASTYRTGSSSTFQQSKGVGLRLGRSPLIPGATNTLSLASVNGGVNTMPTQLTCDINQLARIVSKAGITATLTNIRRNLPAFLAQAGTNKLISDMVEAAAGVYAHGYCAGPQGLAEINANVARRIGSELTPEQIAEGKRLVAKKVQAIQENLRSVSVGPQNSPVPDPQSLQGAMAAGASVSTEASALGDDFAAKVGKYTNEEYFKCVDRAKDRFAGYIRTALGILNGDFWNSVQLQAAQCRLDKMMSNTNPAKGLFDALQIEAQPNYDFGIFTVSLSGTNLHFDRNGDRKRNIRRNALAATDAAVDDIDRQAAQKTLMNDPNELARWYAFYRDWKAAMALSGDARADAVDKVFENYPVRSFYADDPSKSDYWIAFTRNQYELALANARAKDAEAHAAQDLARASKREGATELVQASVLIALREEMARQTAALREIQTTLSRIAASQSAATRIAARGNPSAINGTPAAMTPNGVPIYTPPPSSGSAPRHAAHRASSSLRKAGGDTQGLF